MSARAMIDRAMLEAIVGTIKPGRVRGPKDETPRRPPMFRGPPWKLAVDLRRPVPRDGRPRTIDGATSFHFRVSTVSRHDDGAGAPDSNRAAGHEAYLVTDREHTAVERILGERYLVEPKSDRLEAMAEGRAILVNSSIGDTLEARDTFWKERWNSARKAGDELIEIFPPRGSLADWRDLASDRQAPAIIRAAASTIVATLERGEHPAKRVDILVETETVRDWAAGLGSRFGASKAQRMVHYRAPRGGAVQERFEFELPADLPLAEVKTIIDSLGAKLRGFGLAFTLVVHAPDARNDRRNLHAHMVLYRRRLPVEKDGMLNLGDPGVALRPGDIATMFGTPLDRAATHHRERAAADVAALRNCYAELVNRELADAGADRRFDPRSYAAMGINKVPEAHLGNEAFTLLNAGVMTDLAQDNAVRSWWSAMRDSERQLEAERAHHAARIAAWTRDIDTRTSSDAEDILVTIDRYHEAAERLHETASTLARFDLDEAMARSAADRLLRTSRQLIEDHERRGKRWRDERDVLARQRLAVAHLEEVDEALEPHREPVARQRDAAARMRSELAHWDTEITATIATAKADLEAAQQWSEMTVLPPSRYPTRLRPSDHCAALIDHVFTQAGAHSIIDSDRILLVHKSTDGTDQMTILGLGPADIELMQDPRWQRRLEAAFAKAYDLQRHAVDRLLAYVRRHGRATLERGRNRLGDRVDPPLVRLRDAYLDHPEFVAGLAAAEVAYGKRHDGVGVPVGSSWRDLERRPSPADSDVARDAPAVMTTPETDVAPTLPEVPASGPKTGGSQSAQPIVEVTRVADTSDMEERKQPAVARDANAPTTDQVAAASVSESDDREGPVASRSAPGQQEVETPPLPVQIAAPIVPVTDAATPAQAAGARRATAIASERANDSAPISTSVRSDDDLGLDSAPTVVSRVTVPPQSAAPEAASDDPVTADARAASSSTIKVPADVPSEATPVGPAPPTTDAGTDLPRPTTPPWQAGKKRKTPGADGGQRPTDVLRAQMAKMPLAPDRNRELETWRTRIHEWANQPGRTEAEFERSLLLKTACRMAAHGDLDMALDGAGQLDLFVRTNEAEALVGQLCDMPQGRRSLRRIAANLPPLADRRNVVRITVPPERDGPDESVDLTIARDNRGRG